MRHSPSFPRLTCLALLTLVVSACASQPREHGIAPHFVSADEPASARVARQHPECLVARDEVDQQPPLADGRDAHERARSDPALRLPGHCREIIDHPQLTIRTRDQWDPDFSAQRD